MTVILASDHGGWELKQQLLEWLRASSDHVTLDGGPLVLRDDDDYPDFAFPAALKVASGQAQVGIFCCRSGAGMAICANKVAGVRAAQCETPDLAKRARNDDDANVLCIGGNDMTLEMARACVKMFVTTPFSHAIRHTRRVQKIMEWEKRHLKNER